MSPGNAHIPWREEEGGRTHEELAKQVLVKPLASGERGGGKKDKRASESREHSSLGTMTQDTSAPSRPPLLALSPPCPSCTANTWRTASPSRRVCKVVCRWAFATNIQRASRQRRWFAHGVSLVCCLGQQVDVYGTPSNRLSNQCEGRWQSSGWTDPKR